MADFALPGQFSTLSRESHGASSRLMSDPLMVRAILISGLVHLAVAFGIVCGPLLFAAVPSAQPLAIDVSIVDITELETALPPPALPPQHEPKARAIIPQPPIKPIEPRPERAREVEKVLPQRAPEKTLAEEKAVAQDPASKLSGTSSHESGVTATDHARASYRDVVATKLARAKRYPERAVRTRVTGRGVLRLTIDSSGSVVSVDVAESTQSEILDDELVRMVDRAAPFDSFPQSMAQNQITLVVPVAFRLEN